MISDGRKKSYLRAVECHYSLKQLAGPSWAWAVTGQSQLWWYPCAHRSPALTKDTVLVPCPTWPWLQHPPTLHCPYIPTFALISSECSYTGPILRSLPVGWEGLAHVHFITTPLAFVFLPSLSPTCGPSELWRVRILGPVQGKLPVVSGLTGRDSPCTWIWLTTQAKGRKQPSRTTQPMRAGHNSDNEWPL